MPRKKFNFDVAFSLLHQDLDFAKEIHNALVNYNLSTFLYIHNQKQLANNNGISVFSDTFKKNARVVVLLHREGYGETYWTRIEHSAIQERYLKEGAEFCILIPMDKTKPIWYPEFMQYTSPKMLPSQIAELILKKIGDMGGEIKPKTLEEFLEEAKKIREDKFTHYQKLGYEEENVFHNEIKVIMSELANMYNTVSREINYLTTEWRGAVGNSMQLNVSNMGIRFQIEPSNKRVINANAQTYSLEISHLINNQGRTQTLQSIYFKINFHNSTSFGWSEVKFLPDELPTYRHRVHDFVTGKNYELDSKVYTSEELIRMFITEFIKWVLEKHPY